MAITIIGTPKSQIYEPLTKTWVDVFLFEARFWSKVNRNGEIPIARPDLGPCWLWIGATKKCGQEYYGKFTLGNGPTNNLQAHRVAFEIVRGIIPEPLVLDHLCRITLCVNPFHLEPVTQKVNVLRGTSLAAQNALKTHCVAGHPFSEKNTYWQQHRFGLKRKCRECHRIKEMERRVLLRAS